MKKVGEQEVKKDKNELPKFKVTQNHEDYNAWKSDIRVPERVGQTFAHFGRDDQF
jgi:hypothetical protein